MTFTYNPTGTDEQQIVAKIRARTGDTRKDRGPRPHLPDKTEESNYSDEEIIALYNDEGQHVMRGTAAIFETLQAEYATFSGTHRLGPESREYKASERYAEMAGILRTTYGYGQAGGGGFSARLQLARIGDEA